MPKQQWIWTNDFFQHALRMHCFKKARSNLVIKYELITIALFPILLSKEMILRLGYML